MSGFIDERWRDKINFNAEYKRSISVQALTCTGEIAKIILNSSNSFGIKYFCLRYHSYDTTEGFVVN